MAKYTLQTSFIARNEKHATACTYIQNTNYRQTDVEHVLMFISVKPTRSKKIIHELYNTVSYRENASIFNMKQCYGHKSPISTKCVQIMPQRFIFNWAVTKIHFIYNMLYDQVDSIKMIYFTPTLKVKAMCRKSVRLCFYILLS